VLCKAMNTMVQLTRLNSEQFLLNPDLIEQVEITPTTVITLSNSHKLLVLESADEVLRRIIEFRQTLLGAKVPPVLAIGAGSKK